MVVLSGPVTAGSIIEPACLVPLDFSASGYLEEEFLASGTARAYTLDAAAGSADEWSVRTSGSADYRTRIVVRRPADPARFSGTLLLEWLNVSSGFDADPGWAYLHEEILRQGHAYAAVSAQVVGVHGGPGLLSFGGPAFPGLPASAPARYGSLHHPGDQYSFDIFSQIGAALKGAAGPAPALGGLAPARILAV